MKEEPVKSEGRVNLHHDGVMVVPPPPGAYAFRISFLASIRSLVACCLRCALQGRPAGKEPPCVDGGARHRALGAIHVT